MASRMSVISQVSGSGASARLDEMIMRTANGSVISKRSVERLYHPSEEHFLRHFVKKPQSKPPLINRGYWLRQKIVDTIVRRFLTRESAKKKVVINLGCGSDAIPWQCQNRYPEASADVLFVDVDYLEVLKKKKTIVLETPRLRQILDSDGQISQPSENGLILGSDRYCQVACDLRDLESLRSSLAKLVALLECDVLFLADDSLAYIESKHSDALLEWASSYDTAEICLLEQLIPHGPDHPFAKTMTAHFDRQKTPLRSIGKYPTVQSQQQRLRSMGWGQVDTWDLWEAWSGEDFVTSSDRCALDAIEPFDDWEDLMLYGRHHFVIYARTAMPHEDLMLETTCLQAEKPLLNVEITPHNLPRPLKRRFGCLIPWLSAEGYRYGIHAYGIGPDGLYENYDTYRIGHQIVEPKLSEAAPNPRIGSTVVELEGSFGCLISGGRREFSKIYGNWPLGMSTRGRTRWLVSESAGGNLFRHCALRLTGTSLVLMMGGKLAHDKIYENCCVLDPTKGFSVPRVIGTMPRGSFGALLCNSSEAASGVGIFEGLFTGGMRLDGTLSSTKFWWRLDMNGVTPTITFDKVKVRGAPEATLEVFGGQMMEIGPYRIICGGMGRDPSHQGQTITCLHVSRGVVDVVGIVSAASEMGSFPFMIGASALKDENDILIAGGGANCFFMGDYWEASTYRIRFPQLSNLLSLPTASRSPLEYMGSRTFDIVSSVDFFHHSSPKGQDARVKLLYSDHIGEWDYKNTVQLGKPSVRYFGALNQGWVNTWSPDYMVDKVGKDTKVIAHEPLIDTDHMNFHTKNFRYVTDSFGNIMEKIRTGGRLYLRSLSREKPSQAPADIYQDFPELAKDFVIPAELSFIKDKIHSSVLRVSGRVNMWLHYDVMANFYFQVYGSKTMVLFHPSDGPRLSFPPGASSSSLDIFAEPYPQDTHPYEVLLRPGDALYIPPCWFHTSKPESDCGVAVNIFFRNISHGYADGRDVYGNRDLAPYEKGREDVAKIIKGFDKTEPSLKEFYLRRLAKELDDAATRCMAD